jgi:hypothetical protein
MADGLDLKSQAGRVASRRFGKDSTIAQASGPK